MIGGEDSLQVAKEYGFTKACSTQEYIQEHPHLNPFREYKEIYGPYSTESISAIMIYTDSYDWHPDVQVCIDLLCNGDVSCIIY